MFYLAADRDSAKIVGRRAFSCDKPEVNCETEKRARADYIVALIFHTNWQDKHLENNSTLDWRTSIVVRADGNLRKVQCRKFVAEECTVREYIAKERITSEMLHRVSW